MMDGKQSADAPLLQVSDLSKTHARGGWPSGPKVLIHALREVSFDLGTTSSIAFVGESGSGKSTLAMCLCGLIDADSGSIALDGRDLSNRRSREARTAIQIVFQDSATAFNPGFTASQIVAEPLEIRGGFSKAELRLSALRLMQSVGLPEDATERSPMEFSGGQRQRLAIARALAADPKVLIFDESLSGLDMIVQAEVVRLLKQVQQARGLSYIFISHDIELAAHLADEIAVMSAGRIVEKAKSADLLHAATSDEARALVHAILPMGSRR